MTRPLLVILLLAMAPVLAQADPVRWKREGWATNFERASIDVTEILSGGPPKDGIPSIDDPQFVALSESDLADIEPVISLEINGDARAYPLQILIWHEIVNDTVGGVPVAVTYCPLCNSAVVFERTIYDQVTTFGTTGKLRNSDLVMYDRATETWWQQFIGEAIIGELTGTALVARPAWLLSMAEFRAEHPDGLVQVPTTPGLRPYGRNPYVGYDSSRTPFLYRGDMPEGITPMARVVVVRTDDRNTPLVVAMDTVRMGRLYEQDGYRLTWTAGQASAIDRERIEEGRDVGTIRAYRPDGSPAVYDVTFAFVAHAFHPDVAIVK